MIRWFFKKAPPLLGRTQGEGTRRLRYLGTAGFLLESPEQTLVLDPYLSRPGLWTSLFGRLVPDEALLQRELPRADAVMVGHSHHDHALDAPALCRLTGATLLGSASTLNLGRAYGLPEVQMREVVPHQPESCGPWKGTAIPSRHGKAVLGRIPLPGNIDRPPSWPPRLTELRHGPVYLWHLDLGDTRILHVDSADFRPEELKNYRADILCLCAIGRHYRPNYTQEILALTGAKVVIPCHWDDFSLPWGAPARQLPGVDLDGFQAEIREAGARVQLLGLGEDWRF
jgi:L-ascorbate metabolism protein UlaG (beta-lactamase superfamily)